MIREAVLANMQIALSEENEDQLAQDREILNIIDQPGFKDYEETKPAPKSASNPRIRGLEGKLRDLILSSPDQFASFDSMYQTLWPDNRDVRYTGHRLQALSSRLRKRLKGFEPPQDLQNIRGRGYRITPLMP